MVECGACGESLETLLACMRCQSLAPIPAAASPFAVFGLAESMELDPRELRQRFLRFSKLVHPDYYAHRDRGLLSRAEQAAAVLNDAWEILRDVGRRADALIRLWGGPAEREERSLPGDFLLEVLDWNESLERLSEGVGSQEERALLGALETELQYRQEKAQADLAQALSEGPQSSPQALRQARQAWNALQYLERTLGSLHRLKIAGAGEAR